MDDLSNIYYEAEAYLKTSLSKWKSHKPHLWEDALQEGLVQVWRDIDSGMDIKLKILRRARMAGERFFLRDGEYPFGKPVKSRDNVNSHPETLQKVQAYFEEIGVNKSTGYPNGEEIAKALGISPSSARNALKNIREGRVDHMVYSEKRANKGWDMRFYHVNYLEEYSERSGNNGDSERRWEESSIAPREQDFAGEVIDRLTILQAISHLKEDHRFILDLVLFKGYTPAEVGREFTEYAHLPPKKLSTYATRRINSAFNQLEIVMFPYRGNCKNGHPFSKEKTTISLLPEGIRRRDCYDCRAKK